MRPLHWITIKPWAITILVMSTAPTVPRRGHAPYPPMVDDLRDDRGLGSALRARTIMAHIGGTVEPDEQTTTGVSQDNRVRQLV